MKTIKYRRLRIILALIILIFTAVALVIQYDHRIRQVVRTGDVPESEVISPVSQEEMQEGITQTFVADKDFYGVAVMFSVPSWTSKIGSVTAELTNLETGEVLFSGEYSARKFINNHYYPFVTREKITVEKPTAFSFRISQTAGPQGEGLFAFCCGKNAYADGTVYFGGTEDPEDDLVFTTVTAYREQVMTGLTVMRMVLILLLAAFLLLHCFVDIRKMYEAIYRRRVLLAFVLFAVLVAGKFHFSSVNMYDQYIQSGQGSEYIENVFGESRSIRSDEWNVTTPKRLSAAYSDYGSTQNIVRAEEGSGLSNTTLQRSYSALAQPQDWGYYLFGSERGLSWYWSFQLVFGFLFVFEFCMLLTRKKKLISLMGAAMIWFSAFNLWWSYMWWIWTGAACVVLFHHFLEQKSRWKRAGFGAMLAVFFADYVVGFYPAYEVPAGYVFLFLALWQIWLHRNVFRSYRIKDWLLLLAVIAFLGSIVLAFLHDDGEYIRRIGETAYPGSRFETGGMALRKNLTYLPQFLYPFDQDIYSNISASENGTFYAGFPLGLILCLILLIRKKGKDALIWFLTVPAVFLLIYCTTGIPAFLAKITLMSTSPAARATDILGFVCLLMLIYAIAELNETRGLSFFGSVLLVSFSVILALFGSRGTVEMLFARNTIVKIAGGTWLILIVLTADRNCLRRILPQSRALSAAAVLDAGKKVAAIVTTVVFLVTGLAVHPLAHGLDVVYTKPLSLELAKIREGEPDAVWISLDSMVTGDYLIANGIRCLNSTNFVPNLQLWKTLDPDGSREEIYNRYAHLEISLSENETEMEKTAEDSINLQLSVDDLEKLDVQYILSQQALPEYTADLFTPIYEEDGFMIYERVDQNNG